MRIRERSLALKVMPVLVTLKKGSCRTAAMVTDDERRQLIAIARDAIACSLRNTPVPDPAPCAGRLADPGGAFVTIRTGGQLRGCIGYIESPLPLAKVVAEVAVKSATQDPRFPPLSPLELEEASLEVSILSPLQPVRDISDIRIGTHGLVLESGRHRGLLLPQVAVEYGWDVEEFLENTCRKAGLRDRAWKDPGAKLFMFTAEVCNEEQAHS
jgi:AmmeMemoRadiSam system protein A